MSPTGTSKAAKSAIQRFDKRGRPLQAFMMPIPDIIIFAIHLTVGSPISFMFR
jgi:hypothetical protein